MYKKVLNGNTTYYVGKQYEQENIGQTVLQKNYIYVGEELVAVHVEEDDGILILPQNRYMHKDALGSIDTITNESGVVIQRLAYDAFGKQLVQEWINDTDKNKPLVKRGYTGHEHIEEFELIHMNGRVYDPTVGRFLSSDPNIPHPFMIQSFNRYSYVMNNPLKYTDPSGFIDDYGGDGGWGSPNEGIGSINSPENTSGGNAMGHGHISDGGWVSGSYSDEVEHDMQVEKDKIAKVADIVEKRANYLKDFFDKQFNNVPVEDRVEDTFHMFDDYKDYTSPDYDFGELETGVKGIHLHPSKHPMRNILLSGAKKAGIVGVSFAFAGTIAGTPVGGLVAGIFGTVVGFASGLIEGAITESLGITGAVEDAIDNL
ncbi:RHS repeat domain-containing protein [Arcobacter sp.]|uniref:RHS repeat domain-containing protein n=1 Tax=Arcobacter sp. TaxID=1872629 RepID=UPI003D1519CC